MVNGLKNIVEDTPLAGAPASKSKRTKRQIQAEETKNKIYDAAVREINEKGFNNVSIEDITTAANVAKGTFYTHFESKEALAFYTYKSSDKIYGLAYQQVRGLDFLSMVTRFVRISYTEYEKRGKGIMKAIIANYFSVPGCNFYDKDRLLLQCLEKIVEHGKEEGVLDTAVPTGRHVGTLLSTMIGIEVLWCFDDQNLSLADLMEDAIRVAAKGMMK